MQKYDVIIIGGGIVGLATAMALSREKGIKIALIEAEAQLGWHQTGNNSGVIHSGLYYKPGSLKAQNCVEGREALYRFCEEHNIAHDRCGKLVVATREDELPNLEELERRGRANGLIGLKRLRGEELGEYEPHVAGIAGLFVPETGIVDYNDVSQAYAEVIQSAGHDIFLNRCFRSLKKADGQLVLETNGEPLAAKALINCAGLYSDRVARKCGIEPGLKIIPFRGEYYDLVPEKYHLVNNLIYPVPDPAFPFLGVHFTRMIHGGVEAGPNAVLAFKREGYRKSSVSLKDSFEIFTYPGFLKLGKKYLRMGLGEFYRSYSKTAFVKALQRIIPEITLNDVTPGGAGVRAQALEKNGALSDDFRIVEAKSMIHVLNAPSPAATASISIGQKIAELAKKNFELP